jgi:hypothetical protein
MCIFEFSNKKRITQVKGMKKQIFKQYNQGEILLFPSRLDENIGENHLVRVIDGIVNRMDNGTQSDKSVK